MPTKPTRTEIWDCGDFHNLTYFCGATGYIETYWWKHNSTGEKPPKCDLCGQTLVLRMVLNEDVPEVSDSSVDNSE